MGTSSQFERQPRLSGMRGFTVIWIGQMLSLIGTSMTGFAISIWAWETTRMAMTLAFVLVTSFAPLVLISPFAGALVDRYNRKRVMILADFAAGIPTIAVLLLYWSGTLQVWHLFITGAVSSTFQAFHFPAYSAATTMMVPKKHLARASGMMSIPQSASTILSPLIAAMIMAVTGSMTGVLLLDIFTFVFAISLLIPVHIPSPPTTDVGRKAAGSLWKEAVYGFRYIFRYPSLLGLLLVFFSVNLFMSSTNILMTPMVLARTGDNNMLLGSVLAMGGVGGVIGSVLLTAWGGPKRKVNGVLLGLITASLGGEILLGLGRDPVVWSIASFLSMRVIPTVQGSSQAIWQTKIAPDLQGRVFSARLFIAQFSVPIGMLGVGPLADFVFEPAMKSTGSLAPGFGSVVGVGEGSGMSLMFIGVGIIGVLIGIAGYSIKAIRNIEDILPDYDASSGKTISQAGAR